MGHRRSGELAGLFDQQGAAARRTAGAPGPGHVVAETRTAVGEGVAAEGEGAASGPARRLGDVGRESDTGRRQVIDVALPSAGSAMSIAPPRAVWSPGVRTIARLPRKEPPLIVVVPSAECIPLSASLSRPPRWTSPGTTCRPPIAEFRRTSRQMW